MVVTVYMHFQTVLEEKSKVRLISAISEFSYLALEQISKTRASRKDFSQFQKLFEFISHYHSQW